MASNPENPGSHAGVAAVDGEPELVSVWNETVKTRNLGYSLLVSVPATLVGLLVAENLLSRVMEDAEIAKTYSLLIGLAIVVITAVINARLFKPQRIVTTEEPGESTTFEETLRELADEPGGLGDTDLVPEEVRQEMRELGLYDAFVRAEQRVAAEHAGAPGVGTAETERAVGEGDAR